MEVVNYEEMGPDVFQAVWDPRGTLKAAKTTQSVPLPKDPEELRSRVTLLGAAWQFVSYHQTSREYRVGLDPQLFQEYLAYLLGDFVFGLCAKDQDGNVLVSPLGHWC